MPSTYKRSPITRIILKSWMLYYVSEKEVKEITVKALLYSNKILYKLEDVLLLWLELYPVFFFLQLCHFIAVTLIAKSLLLLGRWHISKKTPNYMHVLFKDSGKFGFQILKWGQKARARTSWTDLFIFIAIPMAKRILAFVKGGEKNSEFDD